MDLDRQATTLVARGSWRPVLLVAGLSTLVVLGGWAYQRGGGYARETARIAEVLELRPGMTVADVGAGDGSYSVFLAEQVGDSGRVFATEVDPDLVDGIRQTVEGHSRVTVILGELDATGLPDGCCDRILLRRVYHHFLDPDAMDRSLFSALDPGGIIAVIDFLPRGTAPEGVPENRGGHGTPIDLLTEEMTRNGFELVRQVENWPGSERDYCVLFRRPER